MVDEIVFWLICAIAAAGVWWAFFGRRHHRHRNGTY
jgi:membrane protein implicated in regulation of membrane protease activity